MDKNIDNAFEKNVKFKGDAFGVKDSFNTDKDFLKKTVTKETNCVGELIIDITDKKAKMQ